MKQCRAILIAIVLFTVALATVLITRKDLCEIHIHSRLMDVTAFMDYETR